MVSEASYVTSLQVLYCAMRRHVCEQGSAENILYTRFLRCKHFPLLLSHFYTKVQCVPHV